MKICTKCKIEKDDSEFSKDTHSKDGLDDLCKGCKKEKNKKYRLNNKVKINEQQKEYYKENKEKILENVKKYTLENKEKILEYKKEYQKERRRTNINFAIACRLRIRICHALKGRCKSNKTLHLLGCSIEEFKTYLTSQFYINKNTSEMMSFDNYGSWHIDHIIPCSFFVLENSEEQEICFHFTNLQPLWAEDNLKKSDNYFENKGENHGFYN